VGVRSEGQNHTLSGIIKYAEADDLSMMMRGEPPKCPCAAWEGTCRRCMRDMINLQVNFPERQIRCEVKDEVRSSTAWVPLYELYPEMMLTLKDFISAGTKGEGGGRASGQGREEVEEEGAAREVYLAVVGGMLPDSWTWGISGEGIKYTNRISGESQMRHPLLSERTIAEIDSLFWAETGSGDAIHNQVGRGTRTLCFPPSCGPVIAIALRGSIFQISKSHSAAIFFRLVCGLSNGPFLLVSQEAEWRKDAKKRISSARPLSAMPQSPGQTGVPSSRARPNSAYPTSKPHQGLGASAPKILKKSVVDSEGQSSLQGPEFEEERGARWKGAVVHSKR
jgi:hypothetical protein